MPRSNPRDYDYVNIPASYKAMSSQGSPPSDMDCDDGATTSSMQWPPEMDEHRGIPSNTSIPTEEDMVMVHSPSDDPTVLDPDIIGHGSRHHGSNNMGGREFRHIFEHLNHPDADADETPSSSRLDTPVYPGPSFQSSDEDLTSRSNIRCPADREEDGCAAPCMPQEEDMGTVLKPFKKRFMMDPDFMRQQPGRDFGHPLHSAGGSGSDRTRWGNFHDPKLVQNTQNPTKEMQVMQEAMTEGLVKYGLPISLTAAAATFLMRRRYRQMKATPIENFVLSALHYYGALSLGLYTGLTLYGPEFEAKVMEKIPDSNVARAFKEAHKFKK